MRTAPTVSLRVPLGPALMILLAAAPLVALGQDAKKAASADGKAMIQQAYAKSQAAKTVDDFSEIIQLCEQARQTGLSQSQSDYVERLASWALNRRGEARAEQATKLAEQGKQDEAARLDAQALADFDSAVKKDGNNWKALHNRGVSLGMAGKLKEALNDFARVTELQPNYAKAWFNLGETRYALGQYAEAAEAYTRAIQLQPNDFAAYISRGHAYFQLKQFRSALADYDRAVRMNPRSGQTLANRADAYQSLGMWQRAADDYRRAIDLDPNLARAYQSAAWLMATCPDGRYRNARLALESAQKAVQLAGPDDYQSLDTLAAAQANAGRFDEAKATLAKAIDKAPADQRQVLQRRLKLYEQAQPYRQGMFAAEARQPADRSGQ